MALQRKAAPGPFDDDISTPAASAPDPPALAPVDHRQKGVVEAISSKDEDTCSGLVFKRKRKVNVVIPTGGASSPHDIVVHEGGRESAFGGDHGTTPADLLTFLQQAFQSFQDRDRMESMDEDPLQEHATKCLEDFLVASILNLAKMRELKEAASQHALQIKELKRRETVLYLEVSVLRQTDKETKKFMFEKS